MYIVMPEHDRLLAGDHRQEAALDAMEAVVVLVLARRAAGVLVAGCARRRTRSGPCPDGPSDTASAGRRRW